MTQATNVLGRNINSNSSKYNSVRRENVSARNGAVVRQRDAGVALERERTRARENSKAPIIVRKRVKASPFPMSFIFYTVITMIMLMFIVYNNSVVNEISYDISNYKTEIAKAEKTNEELKIQLDKKYDLKEIERIATTELGLVKSTDVVTHYVSISGGDKVVVSNTEMANGTTLANNLSSLKKSAAKIYE